MNWQNFAPKQTSRVREDTEWSIAYTFKALDESLPRVLLIGDSICNGYSDSVRTKLDGKVNVSFWASSKCVTDPDYFRELDFMLGAYKFDAVCFNNGLHSLGTNRAEWDAAYSSAVSFIMAMLPETKLSLTLSTPLNDVTLTSISASLNETVREVAKQNNLSVIDLFSAMDVLDREEYWSDTFHFKFPAINIQSDIISTHVLKILGIEE